MHQAWVDASHTSAPSSMHSRAGMEHHDRELPCLLIVGSTAIGLCSPFYELTGLAMAVSLMALAMLLASGVVTTWVCP